MEPLKYRVSMWHGEMKTVYFIVRYYESDPDIWEIVDSRETHEAAEALAQEYRDLEEMNV